MDKDKQSIELLLRTPQEVMLDYAGLRCTGACHADRTESIADRLGGTGRRVGRDDQAI